MRHVLCGLAANPALPAELVDRLIGADDEDIAAELVERDDLTRAQVMALASRSEDSVIRLAQRHLITAVDIDPVGRPLAALALLADGVDRPDWARRLATDPIVEHREKLAACPHLPPDVTEILAADTDIRVVAELALWAAPDTAARIAEHPHAEVRCAVAANEATPPAVLAALITGEGLPPARSCLVCDRAEIPFSHDPQFQSVTCYLPPGVSCDGSHESTVHETHLRAMRNPATPPSAVIGFADHPSTPLRRQLANRLDLPPEVYERLADSPEPCVRVTLAENPAIDPSLMRVLAADPTRDVRRGLARNPHVPLKVLVHLAGTTKTDTALLPRIAAASDAEVKELSVSPDPAVRMMPAERRDLPTDIRDALAADPDAKVVKAIAPHPGLSEAQLRAMVDRHGARVMAKVAKNPGASPALLEHLTRHQAPAQKAFREIARHRNATAPALLACLRDRRARRISAGHPALPPQVIVELLTDDDWQVIEAAAANPSLPPAVMQQLVP